jgi:translation elongation factor EF-Tu-like GTPase
MSSVLNINVGILGHVDSGKTTLGVSMYLGCVWVYV